MKQTKRTYSIEQLKDIIDDDLNKLLQKKQYLCIKIKDGSYLLKFNYCNISAAKKNREQVYLYCNEEQFIMVTDSKYCQKILEQISQEDLPVIQLINFFSNLITDDIDVLNGMEDSITTLEDGLLKNKKILDDAVEDIVKIRRKLLKIKRYYEQLDIVVDSFVESLDNPTSEILDNKYRILSRRLEQYISLVQNLQELVMQAREVYQSKVDMEQNQLMKIFTIITTIFTPLTLITSWYGMNFAHMPELQWKEGYLYVFLLSIGISCCSIIVFKVKGWFK